MSAFSNRPATLVKQALIFLIKIYCNTLSHLMLCACRFHPTCSAYAISAIENKGIIQGLSLTIKRIFRCHPFCPGGFDPVL